MKFRRKLFNITFVSLLVVFIGIQLVPVERANPPVTSPLQAPAEVDAILRRSCYDCHSNETQWPWYSYVAPVSWLVAYDVEEGREELNFSHWDRYADDAHMREEIIEEIVEGEMPLPIYLITHRNAGVEAGEVEILRNWLGVGALEEESHGDDHH